MPIPLPGFLDNIAIIYTLILAGAVIQAGVGFGFALVVAPLLMLIQPELIPGPLMVTGLFLNLLVCLRHRRDIDREGLPWLIGAYLPGLYLGGMLLLLLSARQTAILFGLLVWLGVGLSATALNPRPTPWLLVPAGLLSAIMAITTTMGGPPVALVFQGSAGPRFRGTLAVYFLITGLPTLAALATIGRLGPEQVRDGLWLAPPMLLGFLLARHLTAWLDRGRTRRAVLTLAALSACAVIGRALFP